MSLTNEQVPGTMKSLILVWNIFLLLLLSLSHVTADHEASSTPTTIVFYTIGILGYAFDIFSLPTQNSPSITNQIQITDGRSVNFNGHFISTSSASSLLSILPNQTLIESPTQSDPPSVQVVYVTERNGSSSIYYDAVYYDSGTDRNIRQRSALEVVDRVQVPLLGVEQSNGRISMKDRPSLVGGYLVYVSTDEDSGVPRTSWTAVHSTELKSGVTRRLTPYGIADFSPAVSPSGTWTAVASYGSKGWQGEVEELGTDIYVFLTRDGSQRVKLVEHGGWPCWADESTLFFHRRGEDNWWSIYKATVPSKGLLISTESVVIERVTPPGLHAFTPATSPGNKKFIALATRRPTSSFRHIELFNLEKNKFTELTRLVSPKSHHFNPFISPDSTRVGYHRCRGEENRSQSPKLLLENINSPTSDISLFRIDGAFPSFSPLGDRIAFVNFPGVYIVNRDGSNRRQIYGGAAFSTAWDPVRKAVVYTAAGPDFATVGTEVDVLSLTVEDDDQVVIKKLTTNGKNNAFPSPSPDGKWIVFRSGQSGYKNLYIMDAVEGEKSGLQQLTNGPWTDTMCNWSPDGDWIAFASDRDNPDSGSFALYLIHPNGTGLRKLIQSGSGGRTNHPWFSPDGKRLVFTSDYAAISAEPISNPHHYQPYGEIFTINLDGSDIKRLTHNSFEDGTPVWISNYIRPLDVKWPIARPKCAFWDVHWLEFNKRPIEGGFGAVALVSNMTQCGIKF